LFSKPKISNLGILLSINGAVWKPKKWMEAIWVASKITLENCITFLENVGIFRNDNRFFKGRTNESGV